MSFRHPLANVPRAGLLILIITLSAAPLVGADPIGGEVRPIALSGRPAAGVPGANYASIFGNAMVNDHDQVAFLGLVSGSGITDANNLALWLGESLSSQSLIVRTGDQAAGLPAGVHLIASGFESTPHLNNRGEVAFIAGFEDSQPGQAAFTTAGGSLRLLAARGYAIPNAPGSPVTTGPRDIELNNAGQTAFYTQLASNSAIWVDTPGQPLRRVISVGDSLPGASGLHALSLDSSVLADNGRVAFEATTAPSPFFYSGAWSEISGSLQLIASEHAANAPGFSSYFLGVGIGSMSSNGFLTFGGTVNGGPSRAFYAQRPDGSVRLIANTGTSAPATPFTFTNVYAPLINANGRVAFEANLSADSASPGSPTSVWFEDPLGMHLLSHRGDLAPGAGAATFDNFAGMQFNDYGDLMFEATLTHGVAGVTDANDSGVWLRQRTGQLTLIAREGDQIDVAPGPTIDLRRIVYVQSIGLINESQQRRTLTNSGEVLFFASFADNSTGLFLTQPVPEPASLGIALVLTIATASACRRARKLN